MNRNIELLVATATAAASGGSAAAAVSGDSLVVKNGKAARILTSWADLQAAGFVQIVRPSGHDTTRDYRARITATDIGLLQPMGVPLEVAPQETLGITIGEAGVAGDVASVVMLMEYDGLAGVNQRLIDWNEFTRRVEKIVTIDATLALAVGPAFAASEELITAESDLLKANRDYAVIGYRVSTECAAVYIKGQDTGNVRVGGPGNDLNADLTSQWFAVLSRAFDRPMIPVINSGNKGNTYFGGHQDENEADVSVSWILGLLKE